MHGLIIKLRGRVDFRDCRSREVVLVPHCALNQNARSAGAAERPAAVAELITGLMQRGVGIVQMPCPELRILGLDRGNVENRRELSDFRTPDVRTKRMDEAAWPQYYILADQFLPWMVVRARSDPSQMIDILRKEVEEMDGAELRARSRRTIDLGDFGGA